VFTVVLVILAVLGVWALAAVAVAFLAGGVIHARDHEDAPYGGFSRPRAVVSSSVATLAPVRVRH
jgi:hypothetical protein